MATTNDRRFWDAVTAVFLPPVVPPAAGKWDATEGVAALLDVAGDMDSLVVTVAEAARAQADRFARVAADVEAGRTSGVDSPCGYSSLRDVDLGLAKLAARRDELYRLARVVGGADRARALRAAITASATARAT